MRRLPIFAALTLALSVAPGCIVEGDSSLTLLNDSSYVLEEIYVAEVNDPSWGPNLAFDALFPGEELTIVLDCGTYDALVVDDTGVECELNNLDLCFDDDLWVVDDQTLDRCAF